MDFHIFVSHSRGTIAKMKGYVSNGKVSLSKNHQTTVHPYHVLDRGKNLKCIPAQPRQLADEKYINAIVLAILNHFTQHRTLIILPGTRDVFLDYLAYFNILIYSIVRQVLDLPVCALSVTNTRYSGIDDCRFLNLHVFKICLCSKKSVLTCLNTRFSVIVIVKELYER